MRSQNLPGYTPLLGTIIPVFMELKLLDFLIKSVQFRFPMLHQIRYWNLLKKINNKGKQILQNFYFHKLTFVVEGLDDIECGVGFVGLEKLAHSLDCESSEFVEVGY